MGDTLIPYDREELKRLGPQRALRGKQLREVAFPLGGIGTGCISLGGRGQLRDWEIFNRPNKGFAPEFTFATLRIKVGDAEPVMRVVASPPQPPFSGAIGLPNRYGAGFPHMEAATFRGEYPFARLEFEDEALPVRVSLEAFNPFIPLDPDDSAVPCAILTYRLANTSEQKVSALLVFTMQNVVGYCGAGEPTSGDLGGNVNRFRKREGTHGVFMTTERFGPESHRYGSLALVPCWPDITWTTQIEEGDHPFDRGYAFWDSLITSGEFDCIGAHEPTPEGRTAIGAVGMKAEVAPGESCELPLIIAWHFPNFVKYWSQGPDGVQPQWKNHYALPFEDAYHVAEYVYGNLTRLRNESMAFHDALFDTTMPPHVLDAVSSQASTLKSPTCLRLQDGTFYAFEGCDPTRGCCDGSCTHVWNYAQTLAFLFPSLERSMRSADYAYNMREEDGYMGFRLQLPLGSDIWGHPHAAADGQLGGIIKTYRDWLLSGDDCWLEGLWPKLKMSLAYAWKQWDIDRDGLPEGVQHNTYDCELIGPNPLTGAFYLGALRAAEEMARRLGDEELAGTCRALFAKGSAKMDDLLFNGEYYVHRYDPEQTDQRPFGEGCLSDQMVGQWLNSLCGLGHLLRPENIRTALQSIFRHNFRPSLKEHVNPQRIYALGDEAGLLMCSWPHGGRPEKPTLYCDEVWTGIEYQVASHLIMEGFIDEGLAIVKAVRDRHDGERRNPWNEPECGNHYARAMSSWGLMLALSGYFYSAPDNLICFRPALHFSDFRTFWSNGKGWGSYHQKFDDEGADVTMDVLGGDLPLKVLMIGAPETEKQVRASASLDGKAIEVSCGYRGGGLHIQFPQPITIGRKRRLHLKLEFTAGG